MQVWQASGESLVSIQRDWSVDDLVAALAYYEYRQAEFELDREQDDKDRERDQWRNRRGRKCR